MFVRARSSLALAVGVLVLGTSPAVWAESTTSAKGPVAPKPAPARAAAGAKAAPSTEPSAKNKPTRRASRAKKSEHTGPVATLPGFTMRPDGTSVIFVDLTAAPQVEEHAGKGFVTYILKNTQVDRANNKNPLETAFYDTPVLRARLRGIPKEEDAELQIELRADVKPTFKVATEKGVSRLEVSFPAGKYARADLDHEVYGHREERRVPREERAPRKGKKPAASGSTGPKGEDGRKGPKAPLSKASMRGRVPAGVGWIGRDERRTGRAADPAGGRALRRPRGAGPRGAHGRAAGPRHRHGRAGHSPCRRAPTPLSRR